MKTKLAILAATLAVALTAHAQQTVFEYPDGLTVKFNPNGTRSGINVGALSGDPSAPNNGDAWYNALTNAFKIRANGQTLTLGEADLSALNASNLTSGTVPDARFPATLPALNGSALTALNASNLGSGTVPAARFPAFTGDVTTSAGAVATTLATVNANVGSFGSSTAIPTFTVNGKGLITAASTAAVIAPAGTLTGTTLAANVTGSSLTSVGTIGTGTWNGGIIAGQYGGTGVNNSGKTLTLGGSYTINGTTGSTLNIGTGGTLGSAAFIGTSLGTNGATDDGKAAIYNTDGSMGASGYVNVLAASGRQAILSANDLTIYFQESGWSDLSGLVIPTDFGEDALQTIATRQWATAAFTLTSLTGEVTPNTVLAGADGGGNDNPSFRALADGDIPAGIARDNEVAAAYQAADNELAIISGLTAAANRIVCFDSATTGSLVTLSDFGKTLIDDAASTNARTTLGLVIGTDVQAFDADLSDLADGSLTGSKVGSGIAGGNLTDATVTGAKLAGDAYPGASGILNAQTGTTYTLLASDNGRVIKCTNASAITVTVPSGLPVGFSCQVIQGGAGTVTFATSGTTVNSFGSLLTTAGQYAAASIISDTTNTFILSGNLQ